MLKGSCCCGSVQFELNEPLTMMGTCHCSRCRKIGASTFVFAKSSAFSLTKGRDVIQTYAPEKGYKYNRCFCGQCGTALGEILSKEDSFPIAANCFDSKLDVSNRFHEFVSEKPDWLKIGDDAVQFPEHPPSS